MFNLVPIYLGFQSVYFLKCFLSKRCFVLYFLDFLERNGLVTHWGKSQCSYGSRIHIGVYAVQ